MGVTSRRSQRQAEKVERQLACFDELQAMREALVVIAGRNRPDADEITTATHQLDAALTTARELIGDSAEPLRRTVSRGVYRSPSGEFVVLTFDTLGIEHRHHFDQRAEARAFRRSAAHSEKLQREYTGPSTKHGETQDGPGGF
jgi:hypothetical protein